MPTPNGPSLLRSWRDQVSRSRSSLASSLDVAASLVCEWEKGARRPGVVLALRLDEMTAGAVPFASWGHGDEVLTLAASVLRRRADTLAAEV